MIIISHEVANQMLKSLAREGSQINWWKSLDDIFKAVAYRQVLHGGGAITCTVCICNMLFTYLKFPLDMLDDGCFYLHHSSTSPLKSLKGGSIFCIDATSQI